MHLVRIRIAGVGRIALYAEKIINGISQYYVHQYWRIKRKQEVDQELVASFLLGRYLSVRSDVQMVRLRYGKSILESGRNYFNLFHSGDYAVLASTDIDTGMDIEQIKDAHWPIVRRVFTLGQRGQLKQTIEAERPKLSTRRWTECEVALGFRGTGFTADIATANARPGSTESEDRRWYLYVHSFGHREYMIVCIAYGEFDVSIEEGRSYLYM